MLVWVCFNLARKFSNYVILFISVQWNIKNLIKFIFLTHVTSSSFCLPQQYNSIRNHTQTQFKKCLHFCIDWFTVDWKDSHLLQTPRQSVNCGVCPTRGDSLSVTANLLDCEECRRSQVSWDPDTVLRGTANGTRPGERARLRFVGGQKCAHVPTCSHMYTEDVCTHGRPARNKNNFRSSIAWPPQGKYSQWSEKL